MKYLLMFLLATSVYGQGFTGKASYYTEKSCKREGTSGVWTASGARFDESKLTCAMRRRDWGSKWKVTNLDNNKSIVVTLLDWGPGKKATKNGVIIDLTPECFKRLDAGKRGMLNVRVEKVK